MEEPRCLFDTPGLRISYDAANGWLYSQWLGEHNAASVRQGAEAVCACLAAQPCTKLLSDHSLLLGNWEGMSPREGQQLFARMAARGVAYLAWVYSPVYTGRSAMEHALLYATAPTVSIFDDLADACTWLQHCPSRPATTERG